MEWNLEAAITFVSTHARLLERRRLSVLLGDRSEAAGVQAALDAYRNPDGGYGWGLEPDLRSSTSQPVAAMHALEVLADIHDVTSPRPVEICDWLARHSLADGGVPFALTHLDTAGSAGHWTGADSSVSSLTMTAQLAGQALRLAPLRPDVAKHPWLAAATDYCVAAIEDVDGSNAYELMFVLHFLDAAAGQDERAAALVGRVAGLVASDGPTHVSGGAEGEVLNVLDFTPYDGAASRAFFDPTALAADLERLAGDQRPDGGWDVDFTIFSPAAVPEWRGYATVQSISILRGAGV